MAKMRYRLALDLGSTSLGWAMVRLNAQDEPCALIRAGVRIFSDGRNPKDGSSLAVTRRDARAMRRRRDRLLKRKERMMRLLVEHGFFPTEVADRKALELLDPYLLRARALDQPLTGPEFARALFHINQRRGFKSNRKTDKKESDSSALKSAISRIKQEIDIQGADGKPRTVGELLHRRNQTGQTVRARYRQTRSVKDDGKPKIDRSYDLYIDRGMIEAEFDAIWRKQSSLNPSLYNDKARFDLKDCLLHQRPLKPVKPGRCTLMPDEERAPLALPSTQRFRIYQEVNNLRVLQGSLVESTLTMAQRDAVVDALEKSNRRSFTQIRKLLKLSGTTTFNLEDAKREELKGNVTSALLSKDNFFGDAWFRLSEEKQDEIVQRIVTEESESALVSWLVESTGIDEVHAEAVANAPLPEGYGSLSQKALERILPQLRKEVVTYDKAVLAAGFEHHSNISHSATGEVLSALPYYGEYLQRHVGFGTGNPDDTPEKRYGRIANPTVHIGLNQVRTVVNALMKRYGYPSEVIIEVARDLKQGKEERKKEQDRQAQNQKRNERLSADAAGILGVAAERVKYADIQKLILWEELSHDVADRRCPYSGTVLSARMVLSDEVEIEHILPFSQTLDDSLNNKTVALRKANRVKGNRTPWNAKDDFEAQGWAYASIIDRAAQMPRNKRYRFGEDGYEKWLREDKDFLARALNDTRYLSRVAREYLSLVCPRTRVIPGQMTALLRAKFGLNDVLGLAGEKNRNDHRHHAVDACVIAVTDQGMLQKFAQASASAREQQLNRLVDNMPWPWHSYSEQVGRAVRHIWVSHRPDHGFEGGFADETAYRPPRLDSQGKWRTRGIAGENPNERAADAGLIAIGEATQPTRHGIDNQGKPLAYKGYVGGDNYSLEITRGATGKWEGNVVSTFDAYRIASINGLAALRNPNWGQNGASLVMRLVAGDCLAVEQQGRREIYRVAKMRFGRNQVTLIGVNEANHANRLKEKDRTLAQLQDQSAQSLMRMRARPVTISPIGDLHDPRFKE